MCKLISLSVKSDSLVLRTNRTFILAGMRFSGIFLVASFALAYVDGAKILAVFAFPSKSHFVMLEALTKGLAAKGHQVTVVGHFPQKTPIPNYKDISLAGTVKQFVNNITLDYIYEHWRNPLSTLDFIWREAGVEHCELTYETEVFQNLIHTKNEYDLLITEVWGSDCFLPIANKFGVPHISIITTMEVPWCMDRYGSPFNPAYRVNHFTPFSPRRMTFFQRVVNTLFTAYMNIGYYLYSELPSDEIAKKHLGNSVPDLSQVVKESSLLFVNSHFSMIGSRPFVPNVVEVGGLHITEPKPLPQDIKKFLDEAKEGVILFSFGSLIRVDTLKEDVLDIFVEEFRRLPQKVLWKINGPIRNQPKNVKTVKWLPQSDILRHPNVKVFITHGGLMGTQEAITAGVPMLGIPFFADQRFNVMNYQEMGFAINLEIEDITSASFRNAIQQLLRDPGYTEKAKHYSRLFTDRPQTALETAIYWTEYVIRHKGAKHMKSASVELSFFEYHLLDVFFFILAVILIPASVIVFIIRRCASLTKGKKEKKLKKR